MISRALVVSLALVACAAPDDGTDDDLDSDPDLATIDEDTMPEVAPEDTAGIENPNQSSVTCTKQRFLHVANWSYVALLDCANGVCSNGCWGSQRRTSGFTCDYTSSQADRIKTTDGGGPFASYNEIKPLNASDATAVANCRAQGGRPVKTYAVWNGWGWNNEGIAASVKFAEVYGTQSEASPTFWTWYNSYRSSFAPMANVSPETGISFEVTKATVARLCSATRVGWLGLYFYDGLAQGGSGMAEWKREAIIRGMNYCTTH